MKKVLIADSMPEKTRAEIAELGLEIDFRPSLKADTLPGAIAGASVLVVRSTEVTEDTIDAGGELELIIRAGAGTNTIACDHAARKNVAVANCPGTNSIAVAELAMGLVLSLDRRIPENVADLRNGVWNKKLYSKARGLYGSTLGILGFGQIGQAVAERALAFGMKVLAYDIAFDRIVAAMPSPLNVKKAGTVLDVCHQADFVTIHLPKNKATTHIIGATELRAMKDGTCVLNLSRGGVVDDAALVEAVKSGRIRAASDVYEQEPEADDKVYDGPFASLAGFHGTHHIGASTDQAQAAVGDEVVRILRRFMDDGHVMHCVNCPAG